MALRGLGNVALHKGNHQEALQLYEEALKLFEKTNIPLEISNTLSHFGFLYRMYYYMYWDTAVKGLG